MTRKTEGEKQGKYVATAGEKLASESTGDTGRIIVLDQREGVLFRCERKRHAFAFLLGRGCPAEIYKRIATAMEVARELAMHWPSDEEFPVIQTEAL